jgi:hypothetical protein
MKFVPWFLLLSVAVPCGAQSTCDSKTLSEGAARVAAVQGELRKVQVGENEIGYGVPPAADSGMREIKDALTRAADSALACAQPLVDTLALQNQLALVLHANPPVPGENTVITKDDHRFDEATGGYGHNLQVRVSRPPRVAGLLEVEFSINIVCGNDTVLLVYEIRAGAWSRRLRWQAPKLSEVSDAFGDFFVSAVLPASAAPDGKGPAWRIVVAHGTPWCTSRFSGFKIDLLSPGPDPDTPRQLWNVERSYSRFSDPQLRSSGNTFELRLNRTCMDSMAFERRAIYRYRVDDDQHIERMGPIAINARGFVEEWLSSPWSESRNLSVTENTPVLEKVHSGFDLPFKPDYSQFVAHTYGPVTSCSVAGVFQVQIDSTLETAVPGKPGGDSKPLASLYFHVREGKDGYVMVSAPTTSDPACKGGDLMPH